jgi:Domain of unknown function (DUF4153)
MSIRTLAVLRVAIGLAQGVVLYFLYQASETRSWPATEGILFAALLVVAIFVPIAVIAGVGNLRPRTLLFWALVVAAVSAGAGGYDVFRDPVAASGMAASPRNIPGFAFWVAITATLFIGQALVSAADAERRLVASYPAYFDTAWKQGLQFTLAGLFTGLLWLLLWLGAELFKLITLDFLSTALRRPWFAIPVTLMAFACAIHVTDVRAALVTGARTLKLTLEAWLLPVMTLFAVVFLAALPFIGLQPLWGTRQATSILLCSAAALIFLINAAYQDGRSGPSAGVLRYAQVIAALALVPLVALAGYALMLRVDQYGWTPQRITAFACLAIASCYAAGYAFAALRSGLALRQVEVTNVLTAWVVVAVLIALFSPIADPARISVTDQVDRLLSGRTAPEKFDLTFLRFGSGRYGVAALERLEADPKTPPRISEQAKLFALLKAKNQLSSNTFRATAQSRAANITVIHASVKNLPDDFLSEDWHASSQNFLIPRCLVSANTRCDAILADLDGDGVDEIVLLAPVGSGSSAAFQHKGGAWALLGALSAAQCPGVSDAIRTNKFSVVAPALREIDADGIRLRVTGRGDTMCTRTQR